MKKELNKLREDGLSFRKISSELDTMVGKVQNSLNKYQDSGRPTHMTNGCLQNSKDEKISDSSMTQAFVPLKGELAAKLVTPRKMFIWWEVSETPKRMIELFFNRKFSDLVPVTRIYDVTDIIFNGKNAHHFYEITVPYQRGYWFIRGLTENRSYVAELGVYLSETSFFPIYRSNCLQTPANVLLNETEMCRDMIQYQQFEDHPPKWIDHVSTYSYYLESSTLEGENG
ncbi:DUF4912 domain-containing protein [Neobacillus sp.]|uniref:DUF4912 domain-containing protein n=1 Tax=Neobacillus sp. TaxID=2675273 RepID=UPI0028A047DC|nr:DUF4912 domain-containing protein [Neobacillus sp.]